MIVLKMKGVGGCEKVVENSSFIYQILAGRSSGWIMVDISVFGRIKK